MSTKKKEIPISPVPIEEITHHVFQCLEEKPAFVDFQYQTALFECDSLKFMECLTEIFPEGVFDLIFADPPYFLSNGGITCQSGKMVSVNKGNWDISQGVETNFEFTLRWLAYCQKLLKPNGTIWISGTHHIIHMAGYAMQNLGFKILNDITWVKTNPPPNLACRYFTHATETIIWAAKNKNSRHFFNYDLMKSFNNGKQMKSVWDILSPNKQEKRFGKHPTQKPVKLLERIILASTQRGDLVFDPFSGSSTTGVAAVKHKRRFVGCELEDEFIVLSKKRLEYELLQTNSTLFQGEGL